MNPDLDDLTFCRYIFRNAKKVSLQELGPRFTLKLRTLQEGTFDTEFGEYVWMHKVSHANRRTCASQVWLLNSLVSSLFRESKWTLVEGDSICESLYIRVGNMSVLAATNVTNDRKNYVYNYRYSCLETDVVMISLLMVQNVMWQRCQCRND